MIEGSEQGGVGEDGTERGRRDVGGGIMIIMCSNEKTRKCILPAIGV